MTNKKRARAGSFLLTLSGVLFAMGLNFDFKRVLLFGVFLYSETIKTAYGRILAHCGRYYPARRSELDTIRAQYHGTRRRQRHRTPGRIAAQGAPTAPRQKRPRAREGVRVAKVVRVGKSGKSKVARESLESRKSRESRLFYKVARKSKVESRLRVAVRVGRVDSRESWRVAQVSRPDILCTIVGVVVNIRCNHIFGLILIAKVVLAEEDA